MKIRINEEISIDDKEISYNFVHSSGPGGQNVNKVATAVQLRFDIVNTQSLSEEIKLRLTRQATSYISKNGLLSLTSKRFSSQEKNRQAVLKRFVTIILKATKKPRVRKKTKVPKTAKLTRLEMKKTQSLKKNLRNKIEVEN